MIEQLNLFSDPDPQPEPQQKPPGNPYDDTFWKPKTFYRYNENGRASGWVRIDQRYITAVSWNDWKHKLEAGYYRADEKSYSHCYWITAEDLEMYFERIEKPEWLNDD